MLFSPIPFIIHENHCYLTLEALQLESQLWENSGRMFFSLVVVMLSDERNGKRKVERKETVGPRMGILFCL